MLVVDGERYERVRPWLDAASPRPWTLVCHEEGREVTGERTERWADLPTPDPQLGPPDVDIDPSADATILYTSGTTGRPKGAVATHHAHMGAVTGPRYAAARTALARGIVPGQGPSPVGLLTFPFFHVAAFTGFYAAMGVGGTIVVLRKWDPDTALAMIREHGITSFGGVPATALQLLERAKELGDELLPYGVQHGRRRGPARHRGPPHRPLRRAHRAAQRLRPHRDARRCALQRR